MFSQFLFFTMMVKGVHSKILKDGTVALKLKDKQTIRVRQLSCRKAECLEEVGSEISKESTVLKKLETDAEVSFWRWKMINALESTMHEIRRLVAKDGLSLDLYPIYDQLHDMKNKIRFESSIDRSEAHRILRHGRFFLFSANEES